MKSLKANEILKNKFWIIEDKNSNEKLGTLSRESDNSICIVAIQEVICMITKAKLKRT